MFVVHARKASAASSFGLPWGAPIRMFVICLSAIFHGGSMIGSTCSDWGRAITLRANLLVGLSKDLIFSARIRRGCLGSNLFNLVVAEDAIEFSASSGGGIPDSLCRAATGVVFQTGSTARAAARPTLVSVCSRESTWLEIGRVEPGLVLPGHHVSAA